MSPRYNTRTFPFDRKLALNADDGGGCLETSPGERVRSHLLWAFADGHPGQRELAERLGMGVWQFERPGSCVARGGRRRLISRRVAGHSTGVWIMRVGRRSRALPEEIPGVVQGLIPPTQIKKRPRTHRSSTLPSVLIELDLRRAGQRISKVHL
jgi:hypothetical protein